MLLKYAIALILGGTLMAQEHDHARMVHGVVKTPTFVRLAAEPLAGQTTLTLEQPVASWKAGDRIVIPDTRHLRDNQRGENYQAQDEKLEIAAIDGVRITLAAPLKFDH